MINEKSPKRVVRVLFGMGVVKRDNLSFRRYRIPQILLRKPGNYRNSYVSPGLKVGGQTQFE